MIYGKIKNIFIGSSKIIGTIEYDNGQKLIFYQEQTPIKVKQDLSVGQEVHFEIKEKRDGRIEAKNVHKI